MKRLAAVAVLLCLCVAASAQTRGIVIPPPTPISPAIVEAEIATMMPLISSGKQWTDLTVTMGIAYKLPQAKGLEVICPDRVVGFLAKDTPAFEGKIRVGGTIDWEIVPNISAYLGGVSGLGFSAGVKATLIAAEF